MRSQAIAERLLAMFTDRARASSIVGDLAEGAREKGERWFWWAYVGVIASIAWRPLGGFASAAIGCWWGLGYVGSSFSMAPDGQFAGKALELFLSVMTAAGAISWLVFLFSVIRYGAKDRLTRLSLGFSVIGTMVGWFWWVSMVPAIAAIAIVVLVGYAMVTETGRRGLAALMGLWVAIAALQYAGLKSFRFPIDHTFGYKGAPAIYAAWFWFCYIVVLAVACLLCARVHHAAMGNRELVRE